MVTRANNLTEIFQVCVIFPLLYSFYKLVYSLKFREENSVA